MPVAGDRFGNYRIPYQELGLPSLDRYGGKIVGGGRVVEIADGDWSPEVVVAVEFERLAKAKDWYLGLRTVYSWVKPLCLACFGAGGGDRTRVASLEG